MPMKWSIRWARPILIFLGCGAVATVIELCASYLLEWITGSWPWQTYADYDINFQARVALSPSIRFGIGGVLFLYLHIWRIKSGKVPIKQYIRVKFKKNNDFKRIVLIVILNIVIIFQSFVQDNFLKNGVEIYFLDVGQGDSTIIKTKISEKLFGL